MPLITALLAPIFAVIVGVVGMLLVVMVASCGANENLAVAGVVIAGIGAIVDLEILIRFGDKMPDNVKVVAEIGLALTQRLSGQPFRSWRADCNSRDGVSR